VRFMQHPEYRPLQRKEKYQEDGKTEQALFVGDLKKEIVGIIPQIVSIVEPTPASDARSKKQMIRNRGYESLDRNPGAYRRFRRSCLRLQGFANSLALAVCTLSRLACRKANMLPQCRH